jgi:hypothetical protein
MDARYFWQKTIVGSAALESVRENTMLAIFQQIETMRVLSTNKDQWLGFLRGKVIEHWAEYEKYEREDDLWKARLYRDKLQENLPK